MTLEKSFLTLMPSTVYVYPVATTDAYGKRTHSASGVGTRAYVQETKRMIVTDDNQNVFEQGRVIFYGTPAVTYECRMVLPDNKEPLILSIRVYDDTSTPEITIVSFGV